MESKQGLAGIKEQLPHGAVVEIAKRAGVLAPTMSRALMGDIRSPKLPEMMKATAEYLTEYKIKTKEAAKLLNEAINQ